MWLLRCPYDGAVPSERTLHCGTSYTLGRAADADLLVEIKHVSRQTGVIHVAEAHGTEPPGVQWTMAERSKSGDLIQSVKGRNRVERRIKPGIAVPLADGDNIRLTPGILATLTWRPLIIGLINTEAGDEAALRTLGVSVMHLRSVDAACTHICLRYVRPSKSLLLALVYGQHIVSPAFVDALTGLTHVDPRPAPLPIPDPAAYVPPPDPWADVEIGALQLRPDARRRSAFRGSTVLFLVHHVERRVLDAVELCEAAQGRAVLHDMSAAPLGSLDAAFAVVQQLAGCANEYAAQCGTELPLVVVYDDDAPCAPYVAQAALEAGALFLPQGLDVIAERILNMQGWHDAILADATRSDVSQEEYPPTQAPQLYVQASQEKAEPEQWDSDASSPEEHDSDIEEAQPELLPAESQQEDQQEGRQGTMSVMQLASQQPEPSCPPPPEPSLPSQPQLQPRKARRLDPADLLEYATQAPITLPAPNVPPRRGTRQARRSFLVDQVMGIEPQEVPESQGVSASPAQPPVRKSAKYREILLSQEREVTSSGAPPEPTPAPAPGPAPEPGPALETAPESSPAPGPALQTSAPLPHQSPSSSPIQPLQRKQFMRVEFVPLVRREGQRRLPSDIPNFKKFKRKARPCTNRVQFSQDNDTNDALFLGDS